MRWTDSAVVLNHASTDATAEIVAKVADEHPGRVALLSENIPDWLEADYRQRLLNHGRRIGGTHFANVDADEVLTGNLLPHVRHLAESLSLGECMRLPWHCLWRSLDRYRDDDSTFGRASAPVLFRDSSKLSFAPGEGGYQIHTRAPAGARLSDLCGRDAGLMHLQHVVWARVVAKQTLYAMTDVLRWGRTAKDVQRRYGPTLDETAARLSDCPPQWWAPYGGQGGRSGIDLAAEPWQAGEVRRLIEKHGRDRFAEIF